MDELPVQQRSKQDTDGALTREESWFQRQLGDEWRPQEPGIYRFVGPSRSGSDARSTTASQEEPASSRKD